MYAIALKNDGIAPVFYKRYPGSIRDVSAFRNLANAMGLTTALVIAGKGFTKRAECERLERDGLSYILPLRRNSLEYSRAPLQKPGRIGFDGRFRYNGRIIWFAEASNTPGSASRCFLYLDESLGHAETLSRMTDKIGKETPEDLKKAAEKQLEFGTFVLKTNLPNPSPESVYRAYKTRDDVEQLFDMYKCEEQFATTGMHSTETQEACLFLNHLSLMIAYRIYERLKKNAKLKDFAVQKTLEHLLKDIRVTRYGEDSWQLEPVPKAARLAITAINLNLAESPS
jgi:transposase